MHDRRKSSEARTAHFLTARLRPALYAARLPMEVGAWHIPGEPVPVEVALRAAYRPFVVGDAWGGPWSTTWFQVHAEIPERWAGRRVQALFDLGFGPGPAAGAGYGGSRHGGAGYRGGPEGLVHDVHGTPLHGLHPANRTFPVATSAHGGEAVRLLVEAAANPPVDAAAGSGAHYGDPVTSGDAPLYRLLRADLVVRDENVWQLIHDIDVLDALARALPAGQPRTHEILRSLERAVDAVDPRDIAGTAAYARDILAPVLARRAHEPAHTVTAVGHTPPGSAWLWPMRETVRKEARSFSSVTALAEEYPELAFAASSAQKYAWMKEQYPHVFERVRKAVTDGNWVPGGGTWGEPDGNLPGGEALARQLVYGRRFHREELGADTDGVWLPAGSGMSAAFPQLAALAGANWFLASSFTRGDTDSPPHDTFWWEGIDGSRLFSHVPPGPDQGSALIGREVPYSVREFGDPDGAARSLTPFGHAEGGGPTREMLERARRLADLEGSPRVEIQQPSHFFRDARAECQGAPVWRGELCPENDRGTYTSQARTKRGNRRSESLLREAELWSATAAVRDNVPYPYDELDTLWKKVLLHQCHTVLAGASISWVHEEAEQSYREIHRRLEKLIHRATSASGSGSGSSNGVSRSRVSVFNAGPRRRREVVVLDGDGSTAAEGQSLADGRTAVLAQAPALGAGPARLPLGDDAPVTVSAAADGGHTLDNGLLRIRIDAAGLVCSAVDLATGRDAIAPGAAGNLLQLHRDDPPSRSARDLDVRHRAVHRDLGRASRVEVTERGPLLASVLVERSTGRSTIAQRLSLTSGSQVLTVDTDVDWREQDTLLKAAWPLDVHAEHSSGEIQFGHVQRSTHENTDRDGAGCEVWAHRWIHVGEHGWGVALAGDSTYGYDVARHTREDAGTTTTVRLSLLRAAHSPDPHADRGPQRFRHTLRPGAEIGDAIAEGYALNLPLRPGPAGPDVRPLVSVGHPDVVVEAVKLADDRSGDVVVRLYESRGGRARTRLTAGFPVTGVYETDLLEDTLAVRPYEGDAVALTLRPFQILTLRLARGLPGADGGKHMSRADHTDHTDSTDHTDRTDHTGGTDHADHTGGADRTGRAERTGGPRA
ncbi:alpha-mannosidase [Streptomyces sp. NPDC088725]|uniref:alpha-mannosidase n=1 Tax=Streptomyces sp. NPDC088725 TaxID=3365873 RepID=UPI003806AC0B